MLLKFADTFVNSIYGTLEKKMLQSHLRFKYFVLIQFLVATFSNIISEKNSSICATIKAFISFVHKIFEFKLYLTIELHV